MIFNKKAILETLMLMMRPNGAFIASPASDYKAMWLRDHIYCTKAFYYLGDYEKLLRGIWLIFDLFKKHSHRINGGNSNPEALRRKIHAIHAKYDAENLEEIVLDDKWGHNQLDVIGLFLHTVADLHFKNVNGIIRGKDDIAIIQLLVDHLKGIEYYHCPDYGMWEDCRIIHASSIGSVVAGLSYVKKQFQQTLSISSARDYLVNVPDELIERGKSIVLELLPCESKPSQWLQSSGDSYKNDFEHCNNSWRHRHDCDSSLLSLVWPYHLLDNISAEQILHRLIKGHVTENGEKHTLLGQHGLIRYWGDDWEMSDDGTSGEWPMFKFWLSIIYSQLHQCEEAERWFVEGCREILGENKIPELYKNGKPNDHTPLAWAHALALIAFSKLPAKIQLKLST